MAFSVPELRRRNQDDLCVRNVHHDEFPRRHGDHAVHRAAAEPHHQRPGTRQCERFPQCRRSDRVIASGMLTLPLVNLIGGGNQQLGFTVTMIIYGVICVGLLLLTFANTRERVFTPKEKEPPFIKSFVAMLHNGPWWILVTLNLVMFIGVVTKASSIVYFFKYNVGNETLSSLANGINSAGMIAGMILAPFFAKKMKNRNIAIMFFGFGIIGLLGLYVGAKIMSIPLIFVSMAVSALFQTGQSMGFVMLADVVDYGEWKTGVRSQGLITSCAAIGVTCGAGIAGWFSSFVLEINGFVPNQEQAAQALNAININFVWIPIAWLRYRHCADAAVQGR